MPWCSRSSDPAQNTVTITFEVEAELALVDVQVQITDTELHAGVSDSPLRVAVRHHRRRASWLTADRARCISRCWRREARGGSTNTAYGGILRSTRRLICAGLRYGDDRAREGHPRGVVLPHQGASTAAQSAPHPPQGDCADGTPMDAQSELELGKHYESIGDYAKCVRPRAWPA